MVTNVIKIVAKNVRDFFAESLIQVSMAELMSVFIASGSLSSVASQS